MEKNGSENFNCTKERHPFMRYVNKDYFFEESQHYIFTNFPGKFLIIKVLYYVHKIY